MEHKYKLHYILKKRRRSTNCIGTQDTPHKDLNECVTESGMQDCFCGVCLEKKVVSL